MGFDFFLGGEFEGRGGGGERWKWVEVEEEGGGAMLKLMTGRLYGCDRCLGNGCDCWYGGTRWLRMWKYVVNSRECGLVLSK